MNVEEEIKRLKEDIRRLTGRFPKNSVTSTEEGHVHTALAAAGGGTGTASGGLVHYDYIIDANYTGAAGASITLLNGSTSILYATIQAAVTAANTDRQTTNQDTSFLINAGTYSLTAVVASAPPTGGSYHFWGESPESVLIQAGANSITLFSNGNNTGRVTYHNMMFDTNNKTSITCISNGNMPGEVDNCFLNVTTGCIGIAPGSSTTAYLIHHNTLQGSGTGISDSIALNVYVNDNVFYVMGVGVADTRFQYASYVDNTFKACAIGIKFSAIQTQRGTIVSGNNFSGATTSGISFASGATSQASGIEINGNTFIDCSVGVDFDPLSSSGYATGIGIIGNTFIKVGSGDIGVRGDTLCTNSIVAENSFIGYTSGNEITAFTGAGNESYHNISTTLAGVKQALADIGSPGGDGSGAAP